MFVSDGSLSIIDEVKMETIGRIVCYGSSQAPADSWHCKKHIGINRLYYIHSGIGGYTHQCKKYKFLSGNLYFIPYTADFTPFCEAQDPIMHTYIDFELIPPIITNRVTSLDSKINDKVLSAAKLFILGGSMLAQNHRDLSPMYADPTFWELCKASIIYLVNQITHENSVKKITDEVVVNALETMHIKMRERLTINDMARDCYMSPDSFIRRFCRVVVVTPHAYLKNIRLQTARCLQESGMSLSQIANEVGYADASSLSHALQNENNQLKSDTFPKHLISM